MPHDIKEREPVIHIESENCWCCPVVEVLENGDVLIIHRDREDAN